MIKKLFCTGAAVIAIAFIACGQSFYQFTKVGPGVNFVDWITNSTGAIYESAAGVELSSYADLQVQFRLAETNATGTSNVVFTFRKSVDAENWRDTFSVTSAATTTNLVVDLFWVEMTNAAYLQLYSITNANPWVLTNIQVHIGAKPGL